MPYQRPTGRKQEKAHPIQDEFGIHGLLNIQDDQPWISPHLADLHDEARFGLHHFSTAVTRAQELNAATSDYKAEVVEAKRKELILDAKRSLMSFLRKHIERYKSEVAAVQNEILRVSQPETFSDPTKAMLAELRNQEIRQIIRNTEPKKRGDMVKGNLDFIKALVSSPDALLNSEHLTELRREYAFTQDPSLIAKEADQKLIYKAVRARAAEISATSAKMLINGKIEDPLSPTEFYQVFPPQSEHEQVLADNRIRSWNKEQTKISQDQEWKEKNAGINLQSNERATRISRGIQH